MGAFYWMTESFGDDQKPFAPAMRSIMMPDQAIMPKTAFEAPIAAHFKNLFMLVLLSCV